METPLTSLLPLSYSHFWAVVWLGALTTGLIYGLVARRPVKAVGLALMSVPVWIAVWGFIDSIPVLSDPDSFIPPRSRYRLSSNYLRSLLIDLGYLGTGFLLWTHRQGWPTGVRDLATRVREVGLPLGRSEGRSAWTGFLWFPILAAGTLALDWFVNAQAPILISGDESRIWENMTPYHAFMISLAAAVTEELVYRGFLLIVLSWALLKVLPARTSWILAVVLQAIIFGLAHGGYGTVYHVIGPTIFGLITGYAALRWGILCAIVLHFLVDLYAFGSYSVQGWPWMEPLLIVLFFVNVAVSLWWTTRWLRSRSKRSAEGEI